MNPFVLLVLLISSLVAVIFIVSAWDYPASARDMPIIYGSLVLLLCVGALTEQYRHARAGVIKSDVSLKKWLFDPARLRAFVIIALAACYIITIQYVGYVLPTIAFFGLAMLVNRTVSVFTGVVGTAVVLALTCFLFIGFLRLPLDLFPNL